MDTMIERKPGMKRKHYYAIAGAVALVGLIFYFIFRDTSSSMSVEKDRLTIATVTRGEFSDYIRVIGQVMPNRIIYMDAVEGGRVEERLKEEGAIVKRHSTSQQSAPEHRDHAERSRSRLSGKRVAQHPHQYGTGALAAEAGAHRAE